MTAMTPLGESVKLGRLAKEVPVRIHHLNCGTMCPLGGHWTDGVSEGLASAHLVCHCLLIETDRGLVLVDTGLGLQDVRWPDPRLSRFFRRLMRLPLKEEETAVRRIEALGFKPDDVRHIVLTHLDFDHAGGIEDFPRAKVHLLSAELHAATHRFSLLERARYRNRQWDADIQWRMYAAGGERWYGFDSVRNLEGLPPEILLIPLVGHTWGHSGVAVDTGDGWLLHAGDAYFHWREMSFRQPKCPPGLRMYQTMMEVDRRERLRNQARLRVLAYNQGPQVRVFCAHDGVELEALQEEARSSGQFRSDVVSARHEPTLLL